MTIATRRLLGLGNVRWREAGALMVVAWLVPFLVHLLPWDGPRPLGVYVLPIFWTTFVAVYFHGGLVGLAVGLVTPLVNLALTGLPGAKMAGMMGLEVAGFVLMAVLLVGRWPGFWLGAPLAWIAAKALVIGVQWLVPAFHYADQPLRHLWRSTQNGLPGLSVLLAIHAMLAWLFPRTDAWEKE
jgi:hypothetical protein